jgi:hypothetical protein
MPQSRRAGGLFVHLHEWLLFRVLSECMLLGKGGPGGGGPEAPMTWTDGASEKDLKFQEHALPPASRLSDAQLVGVSKAAPELSTNDVAAGRGALDDAMPDTNSKPEELQPAAELVRQTLEQLDRILLGRQELHRLVLIGILARGHVLLEGLPGLGKTALVRTIGQILKLDFKRIQFTPDLMPGDVLGTHILQETSSGKRELVFQPGPVFTNILLADEINRASPKTQSAMLETMQENSVTLLGTTRALPQPFFVLASQNPIELEGTYPLPEAQLDRFLFRVMFDNVERGGAGSNHFRAPARRTAGAHLADGTRASWKPCFRPWAGSICRGRFHATLRGWFPPPIPAAPKPPSR